MGGVTVGAAVMNRGHSQRALIQFVPVHVTSDMSNMTGHPAASVLSLQDAAARRSGSSGR